MRYAHRAAAGRRLAQEIADHAERGSFVDPVVLALPRGGVPVAAEVSAALGAELGILVVRKVGAPGQPELGVGAIAEGGEPVFDGRTLRMLALRPADVSDVAAAEEAELARRVRRYRGDRPPADVRGRAAIVIDDGLATGVTARAALRALARRDPALLVLAVPVGAPGTVADLRAEADLVVCPHQPVPFTAVGEWYDDFAQVGDDEVLAVLARAWHTG